MRVFIISQGQDTGGQGQRSAAAFKKYTDWDVRAMCAAETYIQFPVDMLWNLKVARKMYDRADVVEHQNWLYGYAMYETHQPGKPTVVRHHGTPLRGTADAANREAASVGATQIVATVDLLDDCPTAIWTPGYYDLDEISRNYPRRKHRNLRIGHGPTVRSVKGTDAILKALNNLSHQYPIEVELTEQVPWTSSLRRKSFCDIWVDQLALGYGGSTIEAMAMGIPVVSGWEEPEDKELFEKTTGEPVPFQHATTKDITEKLEALIRSSTLRDEIGERGRAYGHRWHNDERGVEQMKGLYTETAKRPSRGINSLWLHNEMTKEQVQARYATR